MNLTSIVKAAAVAIAAMSAAMTGEASAQASKAVQSPDQAAQGPVRPIMLTIGQGMPIETPSPFAKVSVTDEKVAEVTPLSDREFIVNPRGFGSTNLFVLDAKNALIETLDITVAPSYASPAGEPEGNVRVYGRITDKEGKLVHPALYQCDNRNCEAVEKAPVPVPTGTTVPASPERPTRDNATP